MSGSNHSSRRPQTHASLSSGSPTLQPLEFVTLIHVGALVIGGAWAFGGNAAWSRLLLSWWGTLGVLITLTALQGAGARRPGFRQPLHWLWPLAAVNLLVLASALNPSFRAVFNGGEELFVQSQANPNLPSTARPLLALAQLWFFDGVYLSCFNLALIIRRRRALRGLLLVLSANAVALSVFGTAQKLAGAKGLYFDLQPSPQVYFFSSFIYHNHWGAFIVLMTAASLGLIFHYVRRSDARNFWHSPAAGGLVAIVFLAVSVPLSGSRSTTLLLLALLLGAFFHWIVRLIRKRRAYRELVALPLGGSIIVAAAVVAFAFEIGRPVIQARLATTEDQVAQMRAAGSLGQREVLYRDTWRMAREKIWFGWGMASYPTVFYLYNTQQISPVDGLPSYFNDAHCDWLQSVAEHGIVGSVLFALCAVVPLLAARRQLTSSPLSTYLLAGCGLLLLYAWIEFPFGNGSVIIAFWTCFFCALQYGKLGQSNKSPV